MTIGERIKEVRTRLGISQVSFADKIGVSKQTLYKYENNIITNIPSDKIEAIANVSGYSPSYFMGWEESEDSSITTPCTTTAYVINVLGRVAAGIPINAVEEIIDTEEITEEMARTGEFFGLRISGHSMEPRICDGDVVIVRQQSDVEDGDIAIVLVNGSDGTCKRIKRYQDSLALLPLNPTYEPMIYSKQEVETLPVKILGKVVELRGKF